MDFNIDGVLDVESQVVNMTHEESFVMTFGFEYHYQILKNVAIGVKLFFNSLDSDGATGIQLLINL